MHRVHIPWGAVGMRMLQKVGLYQRMNRSFLSALLVLTAATTIFTASAGAQVRAPPYRCRLLRHRGRHRPGYQDARSASGRAFHAARGNGDGRFRAAQRIEREPRRRRGRVGNLRRPVRAGFHGAIEFPPSPSAGAGSDRHVFLRRATRGNPRLARGGLRPRDDRSGSRLPTVPGSLVPP